MGADMAPATPASEQGNACLRQMIHLRQQQWRDGPEQGEGGEQAGVIQRPPPQQWRVAQQPGH
jgi:hypothetical protein